MQCIHIFLCKIEKLVCGGGYSTSESYDNCIELISGSWEVSHTLKQGRRGHSMWLTPEKKILLIGGKDSLGNFSEIKKLKLISKPE